MSFIFRALVLIVFCVTTSCASLPEEIHCADTYALPPNAGFFPVNLGEIDRLECGQECSGFIALNRGEDAFRWRLALFDLAQKSIDVQYYLWHGDASGVLLLERLIRAADRGVRVRLLIDDTKFLGTRWALSTINLHPNIEVRTFNPLVSQKIIGFSRALEFIIHLDRLNHRMHNKLMVADNVAAIVGGRNIGDEYFGLHKHTNFRDMDLLAIGPVVRDISKSFDLYWNSKWAYPPEAISTVHPARKDLIRLKKKINKKIHKNQNILAGFGTKPRDWDNLISNLAGHVIWAKASVLYDQPPTKKGSQPTQMAQVIGRLAQLAQNDIFIISPYFIPNTSDLETFRERVENGVKIRVLTNSLASTDVVIANTAYKRYRKKLIEAGIELYEFRADAASYKLHTTPPVRSKWLCLHAKVIIYDWAKVYVGTMNLDPRSTIQNTEMGLLVESPRLAAQLQAAFEYDLKPENSWWVKQDEKGWIAWKSTAGVRHTQPARNLWQRILDWLLPAALFEEHI
jgi:putative cardiolipin synthase